MYDVHDWAEVHRLFHRENLSKTAIANRLSMSRNTVERLLSLNQAPAYERSSQPSLLDPHKDHIACLLDQDPRAPATVILERLRRDGYKGKITILICEELYRQAIRIEMDNANFNSARMRYRALVDRLSEELGEEPEPPTVELMRELESRARVTRRVVSPPQ